MAGYLGNMPVPQATQARHNYTAIKARLDALEAE